MVDYVKYILPANLALIEKRRMVQNFFDISNYTNTSNEMIIKLNSSADYINFSNSYLVFGAKVPTTGFVSVGADQVTFPDSAGAMALFSRMLIESKDGSEISRIDGLNYYARNRLGLRCPSDHLQTLASEAGILEGVNNAVNAKYPNNDVFGHGENLYNNEVRYVIPMWYFADFFGHQNKLAPPQLTSGMRIRLTLAAPQDCLVSQGADQTITAANYEINNPRLVTDNNQLSPLVQRKLMEIAGNQGLDYVYRDAWYSVRQFTDNQVNFEVNKSVSRAMGIQWIVQLNGDGAQQRPAAFYPHLAPSEDTSTRQQVRLGDLYFPQQPLESASADVKENYHHTQVGVKMVNHCQYQNKITYADYKGRNVAVQKGMADNNYGIHYQTLERSSVLDYSGLPINNSRTLAINCNYSTAVEPRVIYGWLEFIKLAKVFARNTVIKE